MKNQISSLLNSTTRKCLATVGALLVAFACAPRCAAQSTPDSPLQKPGWTLIFDDEFKENSVDDLFSSTGLWCSFGQCWDPGGYGLSYDSPVPPWNPIGCDTPTTNTTLTSNETLVLTARKNPGNYATYRFPNADLTQGSRIFFQRRISDFHTGNHVVDTQGAIPPGTTVTGVIRLFLPPGSGWVILSNAATKSVDSDTLSMLTCLPYTYTAATTRMKARCSSLGVVSWPLSQSSRTGILATSPAWVEINSWQSTTTMAGRNL